jgi:pyridoxal phosphate enzyme (YggS family)
VSLGEVSAAELAQSWAEVHRRIEEACSRVQRDSRQVQVVAVTKGHTAAAARAALAVGLNHLGENRVQEAEDKAGDVGPGGTWHLLGPLQRNKVNRALPIFKVMHAISERPTLEAVAARAEQEGRRVDLYLQVNVSAEATKHGLPPEAAEVLPMAEMVCSLRGVRLRGLMGMAAPGDDPEAARPAFQLLAQLGRMLRQRWPEGPPQAVGVPPWPGLSMGMSDDFEVAVEEGATCLRLGRVLFGARAVVSPSA